MVVHILAAWEPRVTGGTAAAGDLTEELPVRNGIVNLITDVLIVVLGHITTQSVGREGNMKMIVREKPLNIKEVEGTNTTRKQKIRQLAQKFQLILCFLAIGLATAPSQLSQVYECVILC